MKKVSILFTAIVAVSLVACGPSKAEIEAKEKAKQDSLVAVAKADSMAAAEKMAAEKLAAQQDSIKVAEEAKAAEEIKAKEAETKGHATHHTTTSTKPGQVDITKKGGAEPKVDITKKGGH